MLMLSVSDLFVKMAYYFAYKRPYASNVAFGPLDFLIFFFYLGSYFPGFTWVNFLALYSLSLLSPPAKWYSGLYKKRYFLSATITSPYWLYPNLEQLCPGLIITWSLDRPYPPFLVAEKMVFLIRALFLGFSPPSSLFFWIFFFLEDFHLTTCYPWGC